MANSNNQWTLLEQQVRKVLQTHRLEKSSCLLAVSGGSDSMALLSVMERIAGSLNLEISVVHIHHGPGSLEQLKFRDSAQAHVEKFCQSKAIPFFAEKSLQPLKSEADMRNFRKSAIEKIRRMQNFDFSVWAHHEEDFLETQVMRLIRGTGEVGLSPMSILKEFELRPFLLSSKQEILDYLAHQKISYLEDPSNQDKGPLRNWLRQSWLPQLEEKQPGALHSLARSLALLAEPRGSEIPPTIWLSNKTESGSATSLSRPVYLSLSHSQQKQVLATYLRQCGQNQFTQNQVLEVMKQLDIPQNTHSFTCVRQVWSVNKDVISVTAPFVVNQN